MIFQSRMTRMDTDENPDLVSPHRPSVQPVVNSSYVGRLAPPPTGYLHLGPARTFCVAAERARAASGRLLFRNDDLDAARVRPEFVAAMSEDLRWLGLTWE